MAQIESWRDRSIDWLDLSESEKETLFEQLPEDGRLLIFNCPNDVYHRAPGVSASALKRMVRSPYSYKHGGGDGNASTALGTLCHAALLEPGTLNDKVYAFLPQDENGKNIVKNARHKRYQEFLKAKGERIEVTRDNWALAKEMALSVRACPEIRRHLEDKGNEKYAEVSIFFRDGVTGLQCRIRPDLLLVPNDTAQPLLCLDLKTVRNSSYSAIQRDGEIYWHHPLAASFYVYGLTTFFGRAADWVIIAAEKDGGKEIQCYAFELAGSVLPIAQHGRSQVLQCMRRVDECTRSDRWPRQSEEIREMEPSSFLARKMADEEPYEKEPW